MIVVYGLSYALPNNSSSSSSSSYNRKWGNNKRSNSSCSSIYHHHHRKHQQQAIASSIRRSSINFGASASSSSSSSSSSNPPPPPFRTKNIAVATATIIMLWVMSPKTDAAVLGFTASSTSLSKQVESSRPMESYNNKNDETLLDVPQNLSSQDGAYCSSSPTKEDDKDCKKKPRIQRPKSRKAESCTINCVTTCIRGSGSGGEGPFNIRRPIVVFKKGFHSRQYCLIECSDICNLIGDGDSGP